MPQGKIVKSIAGFFYVDAEGSGIYSCRARGVFRKDGISPLVGDMVSFRVTDPADMEGSIEEILPRRNALSRPSCANVDCVLAVLARKDPAPSLLVLDRLLAEIAFSGIPAALCVNKQDQDDSEDREIAPVYRACGYPVFETSTVTGKGIGALREYLTGKTTVLAGVSGAGKSSLINALTGREAMETGEVSRRLGRGRNTTRHIELLSFGNGSFVLDTPGFSSLIEVHGSSRDLAACFPEMRPFLGKCYFQGCAHMREPDCAVKAAAEEGIVPASRYENYQTIYMALAEEEKRAHRG